jgi:hypothetical protein
MFEAGDADHEEFVEVGAENGKELDAFEQRVGIILGLFEDAGLELEQAEFAIDEKSWIVEGRGLGPPFRLRHRYFSE